MIFSIRDPRSHKKFTPSSLIGPSVSTATGSGVATIFGPPRKQLVWAPVQGVTATTLGRVSPRLPVRRGIWESALGISRF